MPASTASDQGFSGGPNRTKLETLTLADLDVATLVTQVLSLDEKVWKLFRVTLEKRLKKPPKTSVQAVERQVRLPKTQAQALVDAYRDGVPIAELRQRFGISKDTVFEHLRRAGITPGRYNQLTGPKLDQAIQLYQSGLSLKSVGEKFSIADTTVRYALRKAGVATRPRNGWPVTDQTSS